MSENIAFLYRDPLFGIAIFIAIVIILVFADYGRNKYRQKKREIALQNFTKSYGEGSLSDEVVKFLSLAKNPIPPLLFLANTYSKAGDSNSAIKIYLGMLEQVHNFQEKIIILESLGITYFQAGFLQRAKHIFLEILKNYPRNSQILLYLMRTYESMGQYQEALDTLECLDEVATTKQRKDNAIVKTYLHFMRLSSGDMLSLEKKNKEIISLMHRCQYINRIALGYLKLYARELFWQEVKKFDKVRFCYDLLWNINQNEIPFEAIKHHSDIMDIYRAKGYIKDNKECATFELEALRILHQHSSQQGDITFEYRCVQCKNIFPFDSYRCPICAHVGEMDLVLKLKEKTSVQ
ncbi:tetratricopeptide repeat protein [uncultured Helicobacter sp.]|uniref:tetratricopeptide repeat protein n=1 Tax=uncultured Helicobacter sp. TaxID=175537 RepID=UPI0027DADCF2|nr:tetratricopeptide repeat protein [uncultured Helicobacter sp.]